MTLKKIREKLDNKDISAIELTKEYLNKIKEKDTHINSFITVLEDEALNDAKSAQEVIDKGAAYGMCGIPLSVKDNICTKGIKTTCASNILKDFIPPYDATVIKKLKSENAVILGKNNMDEFAMGSTNKNSYFGRCKNPYNPEFITGGSSGGSAASVSAGLTPVSLGTDTGGSVRQPAAFCGVCGIKPTYGTVSRFGLIAFASTMDQIGVLANHPEDLGFLLNTISGYDENDQTTAKIPKTDYLSEINISLKGLKIGIPKEFFSEKVDSQIKEAVFRVLDFYKVNGAKVYEVSLPSLPLAVSGYYLISSAEAASNLSRFDGIGYGLTDDNAKSYIELIKNSRTGGFSKEVKRRLLLGNYALSSGYYEEYYKNALKIRQKIVSEYEDIFKICDVILTPTTPNTSYDASIENPNPTADYLQDILTVTQNISGFPAITFPCGYDSKGMPIGASFTGNAFCDNKIIGISSHFTNSFSKKEAII